MAMKIDLNQTMQEKLSGMMVSTFLKCWKLIECKIDLLRGSRFLTRINQLEKIFLSNRAKKVS